MAICDDYITDIDEAWDDAHWSWTMALPRVQWLNDNYGASAFNLNWRTAVALSIMNLEDAIKKLIWGSRAMDLPYRLPYYLRNCAGGEEPEEFTMDVLLTAMVDAEYEQLQYFIGLVDAYRLTIWNEPFNAEFYAAIARGFER